MGAGWAALIESKEETKSKAVSTKREVDQPRCSVFLAARSLSLKWCRPSKLEILLLVHNELGDTQCVRTFVPIVVVRSVETRGVRAKPDTGTALVSSCSGRDTYLV